MTLNLIEGCSAFCYLCWTLRGFSCLPVNWWVRPPLRARKLTDLRRFCWSSSGGEGISPHEETGLQLSVAEWFDDLPGVSRMSLGWSERFHVWWERVWCYVGDGWVWFWVLDHVSDASVSDFTPSPWLWGGCGPEWTQFEADRIWIEMYFLWQTWLPPWDRTGWSSLLPKSAVSEFGALISQEGDISCWVGYYQRFGVVHLGWEIPHQLRNYIKPFTVSTLSINLRPPLVISYWCGKINAAL